MIATGSIPVPGTAMAAAIKKCVRAFDQSERGGKVVILITDGEDHEGQPVEAAKIAPMVMVASARPPGMRPIHSCITWNRRSAMPERSSTQPISTKGGTADSRYCVAVCCTMP